MKHVKHLTLLLLVSLFSLSAAAQVSIPTDDLIGSWTYKVEEGVTADITMTFKGDNTIHQIMTMNIAQIGGAIDMTSDGTWVVAGDSITLTMDINSVKVKYKGNNKEMGAMVEQQFQANREALLKSFGDGQTIILRHVVVADNILCYDQQIPTVDGKTEEMKIVMNRKK